MPWMKTTLSQKKSHRALISSGPAMMIKTTHFAFLCNTTQHSSKVWVDSDSGATIEWIRIMTSSQNIYQTEISISIQHQNCFWLIWLLHNHESQQNIALAHTKKIDNNLSTYYFLCRSHMWLSDPFKKSQPGVKRDFYALQAELTWNAWIIAVIIALRGTCCLRLTQEIANIRDYRRLARTQRAKVFRVQFKSSPWDRKWNNREAKKEVIIIREI